MQHSTFSEAVTFLYTQDLGKTSRFYEEVLGLTRAVDQGDCIIFRVSTESFLGFCQREIIPEKQGVCFTFVTEDVDGWATRLKACGVTFEKEPALNPRYGIYNGFFRDPNGYLLEIQRFLDPGWAGPAHFLRKSMVFDSVLDAIGNTPLVELSRIGRDLEGRILAKLEYLNPGLSKKDRIALQMIEEAETQGKLMPGQTVVELTSGNTGTGLAIVCSVKGYPFVAVMSKGNSTERARMMKALGAEVVLVDQLPGSQPGQVSGGDLALVEEAAQRLVVERSAFRADQFHLESNWRAHFLHTGPEILEQAGGQVDAFCDFAGTGGSFAGCAAVFKAFSPEIRCYLVEPAEAAVLAGKPVTNPNHRIQGGGYSMPSLHQVKPELVDGFLQVTDETAIQTARRLAREEGIFAGFSAGANVAAAIQLLQTRHKGKTVVVLLNDSGLKYLSTDLWTQ